jgi:uncharacterized protein (TIGR03083 family)
MAWLRVETLQLLPEIRRSLTDLVRRLEPEHWAAPTVCGDWRVGDIAAHLLGVELGYVSRQRDGVVMTPTPGIPLGKWLAGVNQEWVEACRRLSPALVADLVDQAGGWFEAYVASLDLDAFGYPVTWAGERSAPVWMDVAREYTERWVHQQQIREAIGQPGLLQPRYVGPVIATFVHAVPMALARVNAAEGTTVNVRITGEGGGAWHAVRWHNEWDLWPGEHGGGAAELETTADNAWRLFTGHPGAVAPHFSGDPTLANAAAQAIAIIA